MKIKDLFHKKPVISLEIFPPKPENPISTVFDTIEQLSPLNPDFISVTYGAGGSSRDHTVQIADLIKNTYHIETLAHLTCYHSTEAEINKLLAELQGRNIENILALRGDAPLDGSSHSNSSSFKYASDLIRHIKAIDQFCIGAACYPEGHIENNSLINDLKNLDVKVTQGTDFLITQLFFDNEVFYSFLEKLDLIGVSVPIMAGILPVINKVQIEKITTLCGAKLTPKFKRILDKYEYNPAALKEAGIAYATEQIIDLVSYGVDGIHLYTMNKPEVATKIVSDISYIRDFLNNNLVQEG
jgi:methylenetetrahydrofolate reductase (NADPH)